MYNLENNFFDNGISYEEQAESLALKQRLIKEYKGKKIEDTIRRNSIKYRKWKLLFN